MLAKDMVAASAKPLLLSILSEGESYGYEIIQKVRELSGGEIQWSDGTLYPVLHRLEREELIESEWKEAESGRGLAMAMIGGGVACNQALVGALRDRLAGRARVSVASPRLNTDNAAMIAVAGAWRLARGERSSWELEPRDDLPLPGLVSNPSGSNS